MDLEYGTWLDEPKECTTRRPKEEERGQDFVVMRRSARTSALGRAPLHPSGDFPAKASAFPFLLKKCST
jgi:hypothetical protein